MLAMAGTMLQRVTGNPMASPRDSRRRRRAAAGLTGMAAYLPFEGMVAQAAACSLGALGALAFIMLLNLKAAYAPDRILLSGIAVTALLNGLTMVFMMSGNPRAMMLRGWLSGSTDLVTPLQATVACAAAVMLATATFLCVRWIEILPLGAEAATALGRRSYANTPYCPGFGSRSDGRRGIDRWPLLVSWDYSAPIWRV